MMFQVEKKKNKKITALMSSGLPKPGWKKVFYSIRLKAKELFIVNVKPSGIHLYGEVED